MKRKYHVITEFSPNDPPRDFELRAAQLVANYFKKDVIFQRLGNRKTPDLRAKGSYMTWELKSPIGDGKKTIDNNLRAASSQSLNVVLDLSRSKMRYLQAINRIKYYMKFENRKIKKLLIINKSQKVVDFFKDL